MPDMIVVEGPEAGGHLGFDKDKLIQNNAQSLEEITKEVIAEMHQFDEERHRSTPVISAGGIFSGFDIAKFLKLGASGVQLSTRFVGTHECDADIAFKQAYIDSKQEDIAIVQSPVGMPGRAIRNAFIKRIEQEKGRISRCLKCIVTCDPSKSPYCITQALINAVKGNIKEALVFCGSNAYRLKKLVSVRELLEELVYEAEMAT